MRKKALSLIALFHRNKSPTGLYDAQTTMNDSLDRPTKLRDYWEQKLMLEGISFQVPSHHFDKKRPQNEGN